MISRRTRYRRCASRLIVCAALTAALALVLAPTAWAGIPGGPKNPTPVRTFGPGSFPESLAIDAGGNMFVSLGFQGDIVRVAQDGTQSPPATVDVGDGLITGLALGPAGELYVGVATFSADPAPYIAVLAPDEAPAVFATLQRDSFPNGLAYQNGFSTCPTATSARSGGLTARAPSRRG